MPVNVDPDTLTPVDPQKEALDQLVLKWARDYPFYAETYLYILDKAGGVIPFKFNRAQYYIHQRLEAQKRLTGRVRAIVLKARQEGASTYVAGRFYHAVTHRSGVNAYVLSHAMDTTKKLFNMTRRFHDKAEAPFKQHTTAASANEFVFSILDSSYYVGTAGAKATGRGGTIHYFHGSEVAFWPDADQHFGGVMQSIPTGKLSPGTEIILESTANGPRGKFFDLCMETLQDDYTGEYQLIFTPWYWQDEYRSEPPAGWSMEKDQHHDLLKQQNDDYDLDNEQLYWMSLKRNELGTDWLFKQEYPGTIAEAFQTSGDDSYLDAELVSECMKPKTDIVDMGVDARIAALDPAGDTKYADRSGIGHRCGRRIENIEYHRGMDAFQLVDMAYDYGVKHKIDVMFIDVGNLGSVIYQIFEKKKPPFQIRPCNFASTTQDINPDGTRKYANKRAECYGRFKGWMVDRPCEVPNLDELRVDLTSFSYDYDKGYLQLESKRDMKLRGVKSPDGADVCAMTFAEPVSQRLRGKPKDVRVITQYDELSFGLR